VIWFWCRDASNCGRTLETTGRVSGTRMRVTVTGYDDRGEGRRMGGATVIVRRVGSRSRRTFRTGADGTVTMRVTRGARYRIDSRRSGTIRGFWREVAAR
jgi:hypothetical protein